MNVLGLIGVFLVLALIIFLAIKVGRDFVRVIIYIILIPFGIWGMIYYNDIRIYFLFGGLLTFNIIYVYFYGKEEGWWDKIFKKNK